MVVLQLPENDCLQNLTSLRFILTSLQFNLTSFQLNLPILQLNLTILQLNVTLVLQFLQIRKMVEHFRMKDPQAISVQEQPRQIRQSREVFGRQCFDSVGVENQLIEGRRVDEQSLRYSFQIVSPQAQLSQRRQSLQGVRIDLRTELVINPIY